MMAELRAFKSRGGKIEPKHFKQIKPAYTLEKRLINKVSQEFEAVIQEQLNNVTILRFGKVVPVFDCLRGLRNGCSFSRLYSKKMIHELTYPTTS